MNAPISPPIRREAMRIAGRRGRRPTTRIEVRNPYTGAVVGTVPAARPEHVRDAFAAARAYQSRS